MAQHKRFRMPYSRSNDARIGIAQTDQNWTLMITYSCIVCGGDDVIIVSLIPGMQRQIALDREDD
ncbi:MAG: hypothetical protein CK529_08035 [Rhodospirillaceae bacterium]|nr:MAG: hypothetical protein CK529_08035 [Rhodospirillaceae bacterium]